MGASLNDAAKARELREFFQRHGRIYIVVDATDDAVRVPAHLKGDPALRLVLNTRMPQPIQIRNDALESEFSFSGTVHSCHIPMRCIWAAYLPEQPMEHGIVWEEEVPETIRAVVKAARSLQENGEEADTERPVADASAPEGEDSPEPEDGRRVGHLRVVK